MVNVSITNSDSPNVKFTFANGEVKNVNSTISGEIDQTKLPASGPSAAIIFDFMGAGKKITVLGQLFDDGTNHLSTVIPSGVSAITILEQKQHLEKIVNGNQFAKLFQSDYESITFNGASGVVTTAVIDSITFRQEEGNPEALPFEMTLLVGT